MPEISRFFGIIIYMYIRDHAPPHFHAGYGEEMVVIDIESSEPIMGSLPTKQLRMVQVWAELHKEELTHNFNQLKEGRSDWKKIDALTL